MNRTRTKYGPPAPRAVAEVCKRRRSDGPTPCYWPACTCGEDCEPEKGHFGLGLAAGIALAFFVVVLVVAIAGVFT